MQKAHVVQAYEFWRHEFVRSNSQIENLLQNIARFCAPQPGGSGKPGETVMEAKQSALRYKCVYVYMFVYRHLYCVSIRILSLGSTGGVWRANAHVLCGHVTYDPQS
jgi:hypothetical protein